MRVVISRRVWEKIKFAFFAEVVFEKKKVALYNSTSEMVKIQSETNKDMISAADP